MSKFELGVPEVSFIGKIDESTRSLVASSLGARTVLKRSPEGKLLTFLTDKLPETPPKLCFHPHVSQLFHYSSALHRRIDSYTVWAQSRISGNPIDYMISERAGEQLPRICCAKWYQSRDHVPFLDPCEKFKTKKKMTDFFRSCILAPGAYRLIDAVFEPRLPAVAKIDYAEIERRADIHATTARALLKLDPIDTGRTRRPVPPGMDLNRMYEKHQNLALNYGMSFEDYKKFKERIKQENQGT